jgi:hypothetical protein
VATPEQLRDEARRARKVRHIVDIATSFLEQSNLTHREAVALVNTVRDRILELFPDGEETYELIYAPRFRRLIREHVGEPDGERRGVVIPFRSLNR